MKPFFTSMIFLLWIPCAQSLEFQSTTENPTITYDAPSLKARKLFAMNKHYPVEIVVALPMWAKVRDANGDLSWIEKKHLANNHTVLVNAAIAEVRQNPDNNAPIVLRAEQNVIFDIVENSTPGWVKVRHRDGQLGYIRTNQVWGI